MKFNFVNETSEEIDEGIFVKRFEKFKEVVGEKDVEISLIIVGDEKMQELNKKYRGKDESTDVLSFDYGDIFVSIDRSRQQSTEHGHDVLGEIEVLFVHGMLHVFGYTHETDEEEAEMEGMAGKVLS